MILRTRYSQLQALLAILVIVYCCLVFFRVLSGHNGWAYALLAIPIALLAAKVNIDRAKRSEERKKIAKATRDSVLKQNWEAKHSREW